MDRRERRRVYLIRKDRGTGKTTELIRLSANRGIPIIAPTMMMANAIKKQAQELGVDIPEPTTINKIVNQGGKPGKYLIDELEICLRGLGIDPVAASSNLEEN
jgi:hypothetical protein